MTLQKEEDALQSARQGIASYEEERAMIRSFLETPKTQHEFDRQFKGGFHRRFRENGISGDTLILSGEEWSNSWWIHLLQLMVFVGEVKQTEKEGIQIYQISRPGQMMTF